MLCEVKNCLDNLFFAERSIDTEIIIMNVTPLLTRDQAVIVSAVFIGALEIFLGCFLTITIHRHDILDTEFLRSVNKNA